MVSKLQKKFFVFPIFALLSALFAKIVSAHCPLCTIGAGAAAGAAVWLGISKLAVAMFIGAFAMSMGMWFSNLKIFKKKYVTFQKIAIVLAVFLTTVIPLMPLFTAIGPLYLSFIGPYGTTYAFNYSILTSLLGGVIVFLSPTLSRKLTKVRKGKMLPFQGILITFISLIIAGGIIQITVT